MFNIRVYGLLVDDNRILVTDEFRLGMPMTKFPGGGLEHGEGTIECMLREWQEETGFRIRVTRHYYTTDFFQPSWFLPGNNQLISIYYLVEAIADFHIEIASRKFDFSGMEEGAQIFRWLEIHHLDAEEFTLPVDRVVAGMLKEDFSKGHLTLKSG